MQLKTLWIRTSHTVKLPVSDAASKNGMIMGVSAKTAENTVETISNWLAASPF